MPAFDKLSLEAASPAVLPTGCTEAKQSVNFDSEKLGLRRIVGWTMPHSANIPAFLFLVVAD